MKAQTSMLLAALCVLILALIPWSVLHWELVSAQKTQTELADAHKALEADLIRLRDHLRSAEISMAQQAAHARAPDDDRYYVPISKSFIKANDRLAMIDSNFKLTPQAIGVLGLSIEESAALQNTLFELRARVQSRLRATAHETDPFKILNSDGHPYFNATNLTTHFALKPGSRLTAYELPSLSEDESADLRNWMATRVAAVLDSDRAELFTHSLSHSSDSWLIKGQKAFLAVHVGKGVEDDRLTYYWDYFTRIGNGGGMRGRMSIENAQPPPECGGFLFEGSDALPLPLPPEENP
jgi:hypothetical protein